MTIYSYHYIIILQYKKQKQGKSASLQKKTRHPEEKGKGGRKGGGIGD